MRQSYVTLISALLSAPVVICVALYFTLRPDPEASWGPWPFLAAGLGVAGIVLAELTGYRVPALPPGADEDPARTRALWQTSAIQRFVYVEAPFVVTIALAFAIPTPEPFVMLLGSAVLAVAGIWFHCWPWSRPVGKVADALERDGGRTRLREELGAVTTR